MTDFKEGLYSSAISRLNPSVPIFSEEGCPQSDQDFLFAMRCNGYFLLGDREWKFYSPVVQPFVDEFTGQKVSFFGSMANDEFFSTKKTESIFFVDSLARKAVTEVIRKYRRIDDDQAARIAFILGGVVRHLASKTSVSFNPSEIGDAVEFIANMTKLGDQRSGDAVASSMAMYIISGGSLENDQSFAGQVFHMAEAVSDDPVTPKETEHLGLSQVMRLRSFVHKIRREQLQPLPNLTEYEGVFDRFPTVGAEFHLSLNTPRNYPIWKTLAILNISQYQRGSFIQLSRNDRGVIETRMNPSVYPVTIANWNYLRKLLPELNQAFFWVTINRKSDRDFYWNNGDRDLLNKLRVLGMLSYAGSYRNLENTCEPGEVDFGSVYLGQTVRIHEGKYVFTGNWSGGLGECGQMSIYTGYGDNLPSLVYYLSMVLNNPNILRSNYKNILSRPMTLREAMAQSPDEIEDVFNSIQAGVESDEKSNKALKAGRRIVDLLNP